MCDDIDELVLCFRCGNGIVNSKCPYFEVDNQLFKEKSYDVCNLL